MQYISERSLSQEQIAEALETGLVQVEDGAVYEYWRPAGTIAWFRRIDGIDRERNQFQEIFAKQMAASKDSASRTCAL